MLLLENPSLLSRSRMCIYIVDAGRTRVDYGDDGAQMTIIGGGRTTAALALEQLCDSRSLHRGDPARTTTAA